MIFFSDLPRPYTERLQCFVVFSGLGLILLTVAFIVIGGFQLAIFGVLLVGCGYAATWIGIGHISYRNVETEFFFDVWFLSYT